MCQDSLAVGLTWYRHGNEFFLSFGVGGKLDGPRRPRRSQNSYSIDWAVKKSQTVHTHAALIFASFIGLDFSIIDMLIDRQISRSASGSFILMSNQFDNQLVASPGRRVAKKVS